MLEHINAIGFIRVSTDKQYIKGDSPEDQRNQIILRAQQLSSVLSKEIVIRDEDWCEYSETGGGESLISQPIYKALERCKDSNSNIRYCFFKDISRATRAGGLIFGQLQAEYAKYGVQFIDVYGIIGTSEINTLSHLGLEFSWSKYNPTWITQFLEAERAHSDRRDILSRLIGSEVRYLRMGYPIGAAKFGYMNIKVQTVHGTRTVYAPQQTESKWIIRMFELRAQNILTDEEIVRDKVDPFVNTVKRSPID